MKVSCLQENLAKGLSIVSRAVASRSTLPVLGNILLASDNGRLRLSATNLELGVTCWIGAKIDEEGSTTLPAKTLVDLVNTLPQEQVQMNLVTRTQTINLKCGRIQTNIKGIDAQEFPLVPTTNLDDAIQLNVADLREMIAQVVFAAATDEARPILTGILLQIDKDRLTLSAADGFRLAVRTAQLSTPVSDPVLAIIPARALAELGRIITGDDPVFLSLPKGRGQALFHHGSVELVTQLIEGNYPDLNNVIPRAHATRTVLTTAEFRKACKTSDIFAREAAHTARLKIRPGEELTPGQVIISATSAETGDNVAEIDANIEGQPLEIAFNIKYLVDVLNVLDTDTVSLETNTSTTPGIIRPVGRDDYQYIVMPMHLGR